MRRRWRRFHNMFHNEFDMKVIQVPMDERLLEELDEAAATDGRARAALVRDAVEHLLRRRRLEELEREHREGYIRHPVEPGELDLSEDNDDPWSDLD